MGHPLSQTEKSALQYAYRLLSYRGRSEKELKERLSIKGFDGDAIEKTIGILASQGLLDDRKLASSLTRYAEETKHLSVSATKRFLREKGIPREIADEAVTDMDEAETARKLVEKKLRFLSASPTDRAIRKLYGILYRRGYSFETIKKALEHFSLGSR